jgi:hypothetical protein
MFPHGIVSILLSPRDLWIHFGIVWPILNSADDSLDELFLNRVPARKFKTYQLKGIENTAQVREKLHYDEKGPAVVEIEKQIGAV